MTKRASDSIARFYRHLIPAMGSAYFMDENLNVNEISAILKVRCDTLPLNGNQYMNRTSSICSLCNTGQDETIVHFMGNCPMLGEIRSTFIGRHSFDEQYLKNLLNGIDVCCTWKKLANYVINALIYRDFMLAEFNY